MNEALKILVDEMLAAYRPKHPGEDDMIELTTTKELVQRMSSTIDITVSELSLLLKQRGFTIRLEAGEWRWEMVRT